MSGAKPVGVSFPLRLDNDAATLEAAVLSIVNGMRLPYEILILDDGESTDDSRQIADRLEEQFATVQVISVTPSSAWDVVEYSFRWKIHWDGDNIATASFLEHLHSLPLESADRRYLTIPTHLGTAYVLRT